MIETTNRLQRLRHHHWSVKSFMVLGLCLISFAPVLTLAEQFNVLRVKKDINLTGRSSSIRQSGSRPLLVKDSLRVTKNVTVLGSLTVNGTTFADLVTNVTNLQTSNSDLVNDVSTLQTNSVYTAGDGLALANNSFSSTLGTTISATEIDADSLDFDRFIDVATLDAATSISFAPSSESDATGLTVNFINANDITDGTDTVLEINNALSSQTSGDLTTDSILLLDQEDTTTNGTTVVNDALTIYNSGGSTLTDAIQIGTGTQAMTNAINIASTGVTTDLVLQNGETIDNNTDGIITAALPATGSLNVTTGNLQVGNGTPTIAFDGEDAYVEGRLEVDSHVRFDGSLTLGNGGAAVLKYMSESGAVTSANIPATSCADYGTVFVNGANPGDSDAGDLPDTVVAVPALDDTGIEDTNLTWSAYISADDTVTIRACNPTGSGINTTDGQRWRVGLWVHEGT